VGSSQATTTGQMSDDHLTTELIAAYADGALDVQERMAADKHLARCAECRRELASVADLVATAPPARRSHIWPVAAAGLAAAALAFVLVPRPSVPSRTTERAAEPNASAIEIVSPAANGLAVPAVGAEIVWRRVPGARYSVTVVDTTGATQWTAETTDTSAAVPDSVRLAPGGRYYLYVDALRSDGWSLRSDRREFRTAR